jgi:hypothetical protein
VVDAVPVAPHLPLLRKDISRARGPSIVVYHTVYDASDPSRAEMAKIDMFVVHDRVVALHPQASVASIASRRLGTNFRALGFTEQEQDMMLGRQGTCILFFLFFLSF